MRKKIFDHTRSRLLMAAILAPISSIAVIATLAATIPIGPVDRIILPLLSFPIVVAALAITPFLFERVWRVFFGFVALLAVSGLTVFLHFL